MRQRELEFGNGFQFVHHSIFVEQERRETNPLGSTSEPRHATPYCRGVYCCRNISCQEVLDQSPRNPPWTRSPKGPSLDRTDHHSREELSTHLFGPTNVPYSRTEELLEPTV